MQVPEAKSPTFRDVKDYLISKIERTTGKVPAGAQQTAWMALMPAPRNQFNEVYPSILLGSSAIVENLEQLKEMCITHIVNCAQGPKFNQINTDQNFYDSAGIQFYGIKANDVLTFNMTPYFSPASCFIDDALGSGGKVYVHCVSGVSRSATIVIAFLILKRNMQLMDAIKTVREKREILPNDGFLKQLMTLSIKT